MTKRKFEFGIEFEGGQGGSVETIVTLLVIAGFLYLISR